MIVYLFKPQFRDFYVVERRYVERNAAGHYHPQKFEASYLMSFDDYVAAKVYFDRMETFVGRVLNRESTEEVNYLSVVSAISRKGAERRYKKHDERMLMQTPHSVISESRKDWREEMKAVAETMEAWTKASAERAERGEQARPTKGGTR